MMRNLLLSLSAMLILPAVGWPQDVATPAMPTTQLYAIDARSPQGLQQLLGYTGDPLPLVSGHRGGAAAGYPENCLATFQHTLAHTYAMLEVDPRITRDGQVVLHHDATLDRTTTGSGPVAQQTLAQLQQLRLKDADGNVTDYTIPTLDAALQWARGKAILVLDQKDVSVDLRVQKIQQHQAESYAMLIVYSLADARRCYQLNQNIMMEVMIPDRRAFDAFSKTGIPWRNVIAFVGHQPPQDPRLLQMLHDVGVSCIAGTSRNIDRDLAAGGDPAAVEPAYRQLLGRGVDLLETDLPRQVGPLLYASSPLPTSKAHFFDPPGDTATPPAEPPRSSEGAKPQP